MLSTDAARWLLVVHAVLAAAAVAATTHWSVWMWPLVRGRFIRMRAVKRFGNRGVPQTESPRRSGS